MTARRWMCIAQTALILWGSYLIGWQWSGNGAESLVYFAGGYLVGTGFLIICWSARPQR